MPPALRKGPLFYKTPHFPLFFNKKHPPFSTFLNKKNNPRFPFLQKNTPISFPAYGSAAGPTAANPPQRRAAAE